jgi:hypothetical protein
MKARATYWGFFYGRLSVVEDDSVKKAMQAFTAHFPAEGEPTKLPLGKGQEAYVLAIALKENLLRAWQHPFQELGEAQGKADPPNNSAEGASKGGPGN